MSADPGVQGEQRIAERVDVVKENRCLSSYGTQILFC